MERTGYCVKCKANRTIAKAKMTTTKNGRSVVSGVCKTCGTKMMRFVKKDTQPSALPPSLSLGDWE